MNGRKPHPHHKVVDPVRLEEAIDFFESLPAKGGSSELVIVRNGYVIWQGANVEQYTWRMVGDQKLCQYPAWNID